MSTTKDNVLTTPVKVKRTNSIKKLEADLASAVQVEESVHEKIKKALREKNVLGRVCFDATTNSTLQLRFKVFNPGTGWETAPLLTLDLGRGVIFLHPVEKDTSLLFPVQLDESRFLKVIKELPGHLPDLVKSELVTQVCTDLKALIGEIPCPVVIPSDEDADGDANGEE